MNRLENDKLKEQLNLNARHSSIPSSKELYKTKKAQRSVSLRKVGGQHGHKGINQPKLPADEVIDIPIDSLPCTCGGDMI